MICELKRQEADFFDGKYEVAVPFELTYDGTESEICVYPSLRQLADEYLCLFGNDENAMFSEDSVAWACEKFGGFLESHGFSLSPDSEDYYICYELVGTIGEIPSGVRRLEGGEGYNDLTDTDIDGLLECGYIIYAAVVGNDIVAVANTGEPVDEDTPHLVEIGVDTAEPYRRKGYGRACVSALIRELSERGHSAVYECASGNAASIALAKSLGGIANSKKLYIVGFRDE